MAILSSLNALSEQRLGVDDIRRIESAVRNDFDELTTGIITNTSQGYFLRGFSILTAGSIGAPANGLQMVVDPGAVLHINASVSGTIFQVPTGTPNQVLNAATNTAVVGSFTANSINYVGIDYYRFADASTNITKYIWSASSNTEIPTIAPAAQTLSFKIYITTSTWALNVLPVAIVQTDSNGNVVSITNSHWDLFSLETGGLNPNPGFVYPWTQGRTQPAVTTTSDAVNPWLGGDKQLLSLKDWMNAIMTSFLEVKGTPYWFSGSSGGGPLPTLQSLFQDLGNTVVTGSGNISNGILPNSDPLLVTTGNITSASNQLTSLASVAGLSVGDYIFATGIPQNTTIVAPSPVTSPVTMSQNAILNGTGIGITFYSPSAITTPGQINWDMPIDIRVVGTSLTYVLAANATSTNITLADDQVAYVTLIRDVLIGPNLVFTTGSPTVTSVGAVTWTTGLVAGDYVKVASDTVAGYYKILSIDSGSQVTLTTNVLPADNTGPGGTQAKYAFGSYSTAAVPTTTRNIYIATRETVPINANVFWLFMREDNGGSPRVYVRFLGQELDNGETVNISGTTSQELLQYIGAPTSASAFPQYVSALDPNSLPQITHIVNGAGSTITSGQYFLINSSGNYRNYFVWFKVNGVGSVPVVPFTNDAIEVDILSGDTATQVSTKIAIAFNTAFFRDFSAVAGVGTVDITNTSAGFTNAASNFSVGAPFAVTTTQSGTGQGSFAVHDGDNLTLAIKELDQALGNVIILLDEPDYDEPVDIVVSGATPPTSLNGPIASGTDITLPNNSRMGSIPQFYTVGKGVLEVYLNGVFLRLGDDWAEVGANGAISNVIQILTYHGLQVGDSLEFRIDVNGGGGGGGGGNAGPPGPQGPAGVPGSDAAGGPIQISTKTVNYTALITDNFLLANCASNPITFTLPAAASATGRILYLKKIDITVNPMVIQANGVELIDGTNSITVTTQYQEYSIVSNGVQWFVF